MERELQTKITYDGSDAEEGFSRLGDSISSVASIVQGIIISDILINLYTQIVNLGESAIQSSASLQNIGVAADYAFGSSSAANKMLTTLNDLSAATPFTNEQLDQLAIRMQNMGVPTQQITNNLQDLSNIASATGTSVADMGGVLQTSGDVLALAYQRGSIASLQLRGIANSGIPIYDALIDVINKEGAATSESTKLKTENAKKLADAQAQQITLTQQIADAQKSLQLQQQQAPDSQLSLDKYNLSLQKAQETVSKLSATLAINQRSVGTYAYNQLAQQLADAQQNLENIQSAAPNTALALDKYNFSVQKSQQNLTDLNQKLSTNRDLIASLSQTPGQITKSDLLNNTKNITISAENLQAAFHEIATNKDLGAAGAQSQTLAFILKNLKQQWQETTDAILGVSQAGVVTKGGLFDQLSQAALNLLQYLNANKQAIVAFGQTVIQTFENAIAPGIQAAFGFLIQHKDEIIAFFRQATVEIAKFSGWLVSQVIPAFIAFVNYIINNRQTILAFFQALAVDVFTVADAIKSLADNITWVGRAVGVVEKHPSVLIPHFATGVQNFAGGLALVGEAGPEVVNLPKGSSVTPNNQLTGDVHIHNPIVRNDGDIAAIIKQVKYALGRQNELARLGAI